MIYQDVCDGQCLKCRFTDWCERGDIPYYGCQDVTYTLDKNVDCCPSCHHDADEGYSKLIQYVSRNNEIIEVCCAVSCLMQSSLKFNFASNNETDILPQDFWDILAGKKPKPKRKRGRRKNGEKT